VTFEDSCVNCISCDCVCRLGDLPVDSVIPDDLFTVKRAHDIPDAISSSRADDLSRKVNTSQKSCALNANNMLEREIFILIFHTLVYCKLNIYN